MRHRCTGANNRAVRAEEDEDCRTNLVEVGGVGLRASGLLLALLSGRGGDLCGLGGLLGGGLGHFNKLLCY